MTALKAIQTGLRQLGLVGDDARDLYERMTGKRSLRAMAPKEQEAVLGELRRLGFKSFPGGRRKPLTGRYARKLQALWIDAWNLGLVRQRDDRALIAFAKRQTGIDHVRFLHHGEDAARVIEALKGWMAREAGVDWRLGAELPYWKRSAGFKVVTAQWQLLERSGRLPTDDGFATFVCDLTGAAVKQASDDDWIVVMNTLGHLVRQDGPR